MVGKNDCDGGARLNRKGACPAHRRLLGDSRNEAGASEEFDEVGLVDAAEVGQFDDVEAALPGLALGDEGGVGAEVGGDLALRQPGRSRAWRRAPSSRRYFALCGDLSMCRLDLGGRVIGGV